MSGQFHLLFVAIVLFVGGLAASLARVRWDHERLRIGAKAALWSGVAVSLVVLIWHVRERVPGTWLPLEDNFEAFVWLSVLLAAFVLYVQRARSIAGLDWFVIPVVVLLQVAAIVFAGAKPQAYVDTTWSVVHRVTAYGGAVAFALAGAAGALFLVAERRLRNKTPSHGPRLGSLERLEHITFVAVTLGFALLTIGLVTGVVRILKDGGHTRLGANWFASPKVVLTVAVWVVYALVLHAPINPSFRGRKVAMLSIAGLVLMIGTLVAVNFMPDGGGSH
jgi:ABC-type transport system involved in cytochrome c biogenesis permease subunit